jgi:outer membrane protein assembly factor BamE (lipoprotein component of BamABCDE complex)
MAPSHRRDVDSKGNLTVGTVQRSIKHGMSSVEVAEVLGSPNIVQNDGAGEVWIYDKISSQVSTSASSGTIILISGASGASSSSQRTLTVIIKFDEESKVRKFSYHTSRF